MNYLAHAYLSFNHRDILTGNMINDFIKGKKQYTYPSLIQTGFHLHRFIDYFTDSHAATAEAKSYFRPAYRLYSGAFVDIVYDHFLASDKARFLDHGSLLEFTFKIYRQLDQNQTYFPQPFRQMFGYMQQQNWLYNYQSKTGIRSSFNGLVNRARYLNESVRAFEIFEQHYDTLHECYKMFFPELQEETFKKYRQLIEE